MPAYENTTFANLTAKRQEIVREKIAELWAEGYTSEEIAKKVKIARTSVSSSISNLTRKHLGPKKK